MNANGAKNVTTESVESPVSAEASRITARGAPIATAAIARRAVEKIAIVAWHKIRAVYLDVRITNVLMIVLVATLTCNALRFGSARKIQKVQVQTVANLWVQCARPVRTMWTVVANPATTANTFAPESSVFPTMTAKV